MTYAGHPVRYKFQYPATRWNFRSYIKRSDETEYDVCSSPERIELARPLLPPDSSVAYVEYRTLIELTARALLKYDCCIFHSVSFVWRGKAYLLTAPSGTGKTTQYFNWQRLFGGEIEMISGDMPVLERRSDGSIWVHPTSWNGKENIGSKRFAPLAGIVLLEQGDHNAITRMEPRDAIMPFFEQFIVRPETEEQILALARLMDQMLRHVPVWKLVNLGDDASTRLLRETLSEETGGNCGEV